MKNVDIFCRSGAYTQKVACYGQQTDQGHGPFDTGFKRTEIFDSQLSFGIN